MKFPKLAHGASSGFRPDNGVSWGFGFRVIFIWSKPETDLIGMHKNACWDIVLHLGINLFPVG